MVERPSDGQRDGLQVATTIHLASQKCCKVDWRTLEQRRVDSRLCMLYEIRNHIEEEHYVHRSTVRRSHQYRQLRADRDYTRFSFFPRTIIKWNQLSSQTCVAEPLDTFKVYRPRSWRSSIQDSINFQDIFYLFSLSLSLFSSLYLSLFLFLSLRQLGSTAGISFVLLKVTCSPNPEP